MQKETANKNKYKSTSKSLQMDKKVEIYLQANYYSCNNHNQLTKNLSQMWKSLIFSELGI